MRCTRCREEAWVEVRRHNAAYCGDCFERFFRDQVERAIGHDKMFSKEDQILVAVSGGKDSLALWDVLLDLGYDADGLYIDLGIGEYSSNSRVMSEQFAAARDRTLHISSLDQSYGVTVPLIAEQTRRAPCSGLRPGEAVPVQPRGGRARLRRRGDRPQPGRRGGHAARERPALADRLPGAAGSRPGGRRSPAWSAR